MFLEDFTDGSSLLFKALNHILNGTVRNLSSRGRESSWAFTISLSLSWENHLLTEHNSPLSRLLSFPALNCSGGIQNLHFSQFCLLSLSSALLSSNYHTETDSELTLGHLWIYTSRGGSCIKYLVPNLGVLRQISLLAFYKTEPIITFTNCPMSTSLL